jgi:steroid delta-isomerase-like uncharacterized protein
MFSTVSLGGIMKSIERRAWPLTLTGIVLLLCFAFSCQDKAAMAELQHMKAQREAEAQNAATLRRFLEESDKRNLDAWREICTSDYRLHFAGETPKSLEEHIQANKAGPEAFPDFRHTIEDILAQGDKAVFRVTLHGTHQGTFMGIPATGKSIQYTAMGMARFRDGKIAEMWMDADFLGLFQQLGMELKLKEVKK